MKDENMRDRERRGRLPLSDGTPVTTLGGMDIEAGWDRAGTVVSCAARLFRKPASPPRHRWRAILPGTTDPNTGRLHRGRRHRPVRAVPRPEAVRDGRTAGRGGGPARR